MKEYAGPAAAPVVVTIAFRLLNPLTVSAGDPVAGVLIVIKPLLLIDRRADPLVANPN